MRAKILIALLITADCVFVFSYPLNSHIENEIDGSIPKTCIFGFTFDPADGVCHLTLSIAGKIDTNSTQLHIVCPDGYTYSGIGELCQKAERISTTEVIAAPIVCKSGSKPDLNGKCREIW